MRTACQLAPTILAYFVAGVLTVISQTFYSIFFKEDNFTDEIIVCIIFEFNFINCCLKKSKEKITEIKMQNTTKNNNETVVYNS